MIEISNLTFGYGLKSLLFNSLNLKLERGHIYGLLGKNGAGKSTLLKNIAGLVVPKAGFCKVNGHKSSRRVPSFLQEQFFIPEELYLPAVNAAQFAKGTAHFYPKFDLDMFWKILADFDVPHEGMLNKLSFGQQKKVLIALGLATNTSLLIMDEPTNGLDIPSKIQFRKVIASVLTDERCIIISTHQVRDLDSLIDTLIVLNNKEVVLNKSVDDILSKIQFVPASKAGSADVLYQESQSMGVNTIVAGREDTFGKVETELLFNAIVDGNNSVLTVLR
ncbi:ABC transporter ATP-binding protein [Pedobacter psychroterrae]|uniref:ABC transporter ATP-binding protein n=1 Tax=Pedobacter psychroterrae TaxID=2530453 RepID=A0A4V2MK10_9SPHI|nr:ABC transporter ATP-binding protein [Pedobacter psychroterrae]TCC96406.1 ABC transporter ATP-binding protein [Pedobacter psychroterrae]